MMWQERKRVFQECPVLRWLFCRRMREKPQKETIW